VVRQLALGRASEVEEVGLMSVTQPLFHAKNPESYPQDSYWQVVAAKGLARREQQVLRNQHEDGRLRVRASMKMADVHD
jgi:hypothetical protein